MWHRLQPSGTCPGGPKGNTMHYEPGWGDFFFFIEDQGQFYLICLLGNIQLSFVTSEGQY